MTGTPVVQSTSAISESLAGDAVIATATGTLILHGARKDVLAQPLHRGSSFPTVELRSSNRWGCVTSVNRRPDNTRRPFDRSI